MFEIRRWIDPFNERGEYNYSETHHPKREVAISLAEDKRFDRTLVLDLNSRVEGGSPGSFKSIYSRGWDSR